MEDVDDAFQTGADEDTNKTQEAQTGAEEPGAEQEPGAPKL